MSLKSNNLDGMSQKERVEKILNNISKNKKLHVMNTPEFKSWSGEIETYYKNRKNDKVNLKPYEDIIFPSVSVGNVNSDIFLYAPEDIVVRMFYHANRGRYRNFFDIGANVGLDTLFGASLGWNVFSFEPDPYNFSILKNNILLNNFKNVKLYQKAVSNISSVTKFISVKGNTTASHIAGARDYYGDVDKITVNTMAFNEIGLYPDLMKINIEGHEAVVLTNIPLSKWENLDCFVALHDNNIRNEVFDFFKDTNINLFSQKIGWRKANKANDLSLETIGSESKEKDGYVFVSAKKNMIWNDRK